MSSLGGIMQGALTGLQASQLGLSVTSNNVSNSQTPGYSRERLDLAASPEQGVEVVGIEAMRDQLTTARLNQETSSMSAQNSLQQSLQHIQSSFNDTAGTGMLSSLTGFFNSFQTLSTGPESSTNREAVKQAALSLINAFNTQASNLQDQAQGANQAVASDVNTINSLTAQIASLTAQIQQNRTAGDSQNALIDQRAQLVQQLSQTIDVREIQSGSTYELTTGVGTALVLNGQAQALNASPGANGSYAVMAGNADITSQIGGGDLQAQIQVRDQMVPSYLNQLDQLAYQVTQQVNSVHSTAYDLNGNTGINFFTPLTSASGAASSIALSSNVAASTSAIAASRDGTSGDNAAAITIGNLLNAPVSTGNSVTDQYSSLVYNIGNDTANAQASYQEHNALVTQLQNMQQSVSGVSIDEETADILQFQRSFQASAQVISVVNQLMSTALSMEGSATG